MKRTAALTIATLLAISACGRDDDTSTDEADWFTPFEGIERYEEHNGERIGISDTERNIYVQDCDLADQLTSEGQPFGPTPRDENGDFEFGYGSVCDTTQTK